MMTVRQRAGYRRLAPNPKDCEIRLVNYGHEIMTFRWLSPLHFGLGAKSCLRGQNGEFDMRAHWIWRMKDSGFALTALLIWIGQSAASSQQGSNLMDARLVVRSPALAPL